MTLKVDERKGEIFALLSGLAYGLIGYFGIQIIEAGASVANMLFWRFLVATLLIALVFVPRFELAKLSLTKGLAVFLHGMIFYGASAILYFVASKYMGTGLAMVIFFSYPAMVLAFNIVFYRLKISLVYLLAFALLIIGLLLLVDAGEYVLDFTGLVLGLLAAVMYAGYILVSKKMQIAPLYSTLMVTAGSAASCLLYSLFDDSFAIPLGIEQWSNIVALAVICTALPILLLLKSLSYISSEKASLLSVMEPVFVTIFGVILLNEKISFWQVIGSSTVLAAAVLTMLPKRKVNALEKSLPNMVGNNLK